MRETARSTMVKVQIVTERMSVIKSFANHNLVNEFLSDKADGIACISEETNGGIRSLILDLKTRTILS